MHPEQLIDVSGPEHETLFHCLYVDILKTQDNDLCKIESRSNELLEKLENVDDRALAIVGAVIVEQSLDLMLSRLLPGIGGQKDSQRRSFNSKLSLCFAAKICPDRILDGVQVINNARNLFAHSIEHKTFKDLPKKILDQTHGHLTRFNESMAKDVNERSKFVRLVGITSKTINLYAVQLDVLQRKIRSKEFLQRA